jgi:hypothetical protein
VRRNDTLMRYDVTWCHPNGNQAKTSVSIRKYGDNRAFNLACKIRQSKELERLSV